MTRPFLKLEIEYIVVQLNPHVDTTNGHVFDLKVMDDPNRINQRIARVTVSQTFKDWLDVFPGLKRVMDQAISNLAEPNWHTGQSLSRQLNDYYLSVRAGASDLVLDLSSVGSAVGGRTPGDCFPVKGLKFHQLAMEWMNPQPLSQTFKLVCVDHDMQVKDTLFTVHSFRDSTIAIHIHPTLNEWLVTNGQQQDFIKAVNSSLLLSYPIGPVAFLQSDLESMFKKVDEFLRACVANEAMHVLQHGPRQTGHNLADLFPAYFAPPTAGTYSSVARGPDGVTVLDTPSGLVVNTSGVTTFDAEGKLPIYIVVSYEKVTGLSGVHKAFRLKENAEKFRDLLFAYKEAEPPFPEHLFLKGNTATAEEAAAISTHPEYLTWEKVNEEWQKASPVPAWPATADGFTINNMELE